VGNDHTDLDGGKDAITINASTITADGARTNGEGGEHLDPLNHGAGQLYCEQD
jgi:hypothetical protein